MVTKKQAPAVKPNRIWLEVERPRQLLRSRLGALNVRLYEIAFPAGA